MEHAPSAFRAAMCSGTQYPLGWGFHALRRWRDNANGMNWATVRRRFGQMTKMTSEDRDDLDDTIEDEIEVDEFARAAAREASAMLLELLVTHHGRRATTDRG